jgi:enoyl-CoA hydratase/carnithine racemase
MLEQWVPHDLAKPLICAVNGVCAGGGLHFVGGADFTIASERATFLDPHVSVGHVSGIETIELTYCMPVPTVLRMALLGRHESMDAARALQAGLVTEVVPAERLLPRALELAIRAELACGGAAHQGGHPRVTWPAAARRVPAGLAADL